MAAKKDINPFRYAQEKLGLSDVEATRRLAKIVSGFDSRTKAKVEIMMKRFNRIVDQMEKGYKYKKIWIEPTTVKKHQRDGYHVHRLIAPKGAKR